MASFWTGYLWPTVLTAVEVVAVVVPLLLSSGYHLSYDIAARPAFTFRFLDSGDAEEDILEATERAELSARAWLTERGYGYKNLRSSAEDLSQAPLGKRRRQALNRPSS